MGLLIWLVAFVFWAGVAFLITRLAVQSFVKDPVFKQHVKAAVREALREHDGSRT